MTADLLPVPAIAVPPALPVDPFLFDVDGLHTLASATVVRKGLQCFKEHRVTDLAWSDERLWASVASDVVGDDFDVDIEPADGALSLDCPCADKTEPVCPHAVAVLFAYAARQQVTDSQAQSAADAAVEQRVQAGRNEVRVEHVAGEPWFGTWEAKSLTSTGAALRPYRVQIRSLTERLNTCTCPDFAVNRLGTCKHVEAVLHRLQRRRARGRRLPVAVVHLDRQTGDTAQIRVRGAPDLQPETGRLLDRHFDAGGFLRGTLPDAWYALERDVQALPDPGQVSLGEDAAELARRAAEDVARDQRRERVRAEIQQHGGHLPGVRARLFPYQQHGVAFLAGNGRALLADDMGLGKTLQAIAAATWLVQHEGVRRVVVVCPASLKRQWVREVHKFTGLDAVEVEGGPAARLRAYQSEAQFLIVNYELLLRDQSVLVEQCPPDLLIFDEAQRIKNWQTRTAAVVKSIPSRYAFVLSGTPLENRLADLYSVLQLVDPRVLGPLWRFELDFHVKDERGKVVGYRNLTELRRRLSGVMLRRQRTLVRDQLPDRLDVRLDLPLTPRQIQLHDGALSAARQIAERAGTRPLTPAEEKLLLSALQTARMACNAAGLVDKQTQGSPKLDEVGRLLDELCVQGGRKVVVFSQWERMTAMAEDVARGLGLGTVRLHGGVPTGKRGGLIERFEKDADVQVFFSTDAGATGLNLQCASALINLDLPWNPAVLEQRLARVHRLGQKEKVLIMLLVAAGSYEERVGQLLAGKQHLFGQVVEPEATEDVVGVSKKVLEAAIEAIGKPESAGEETAGPDPEVAAGAAEAGSEGPQPEPQLEPQPDQGPGPRPQPATAASDADAAAGPDPVAAAVAAIGQRLGSRVERILLAGGGVLAVLDRVDDEAQAVAEALSAEVAVAVIDARTHAALERLGAGSPVAGAREAFRRPEPPAVPPLLALARRKLQAAEVLLDSECAAEAMTLLTQALLAATAQRAGLDAVPEAAPAMWLYGDLVPRSVVSVEDAAAVLRAAGLAMVPEVPTALALLVREDARRLVGVA